MRLKEQPTRENVRTAYCPACGANPGHPCTEYRDTGQHGKHKGAVREKNHARRIAAYKNPPQPKVVETGYLAVHEGESPIDKLAAKFAAEGCTEILIENGVIHMRGVNGKRQRVTIKFEGHLQ